MKPAKRPIPTQKANNTNNNSKKKKLSLRDTLQARIAWRKQHKQPQIPYINNRPEVFPGQKLVHPFTITKSKVNLEVVKNSKAGNYDIQPSTVSLERMLRTKLPKYFADFMKSFWKCVVARYVFVYDGHGNFGATLSFSYNYWLTCLERIDDEHTKKSLQGELANLPAIAIADDMRELENVLVYFVEDYKDFKQDEIWSYARSSNKFHKIASSWEKLMAQLMTNEERNEYISMTLQCITDKDSNKLVPFLNEGKMNEERLETCEVLNPHDVPRKHWAVVTHEVFGTIYFQPGEGWRGVVKKVDENDKNEEEAAFLLEGDLMANFTSPQINAFKSFCSQKDHFLKETYEHLYEIYMEHFDGLGLEWGNDDDEDGAESENSGVENVDNNGENKAEEQADSHQEENGEQEDLTKKKKILASIGLVEVRFPAKPQREGGTKDDRVFAVIAAAEWQSDEGLGGALFVNEKFKEHADGDLTIFFDLDYV